MSNKVLKVLLIEDNPGDVRLIQELLKGTKIQQFHVEHVDHLSSGLERLAQGDIDIILLDLFLPDSNGLNSFVKINKLSPHIPIVVLTGLDDDGVALQAVSSGAQDYLVKGKVNSELLNRTLRYAIERKQIEEKILRYQMRLRSMALELTLLEERERREIATVIHDQVSQSLAVCRIKLLQFMEQESISREMKELEEIQKIIEESIQFTRSLTFELSPPILYELGIESAIDWLCEDFQKKYSLQVKFTDDRQPKSIGHEIEVILFKTVRELLMNIVKHAHAKTSWISLAKEDSFIKIDVGDDGIGMASNIMDFTQTKGFGLFNVQERLASIGGSLKIQSSPGQGTEVTLFAPLCFRYEHLAV